MTAGPGDILSVAKFTAAHFLAAALGIQAAISPALGAQAAAGPMASAGPDIPEVYCRKGIIKARLSATGVKAGDPAYIEFRTRLTTLIPSGHMYVVFGRLDDKGTPVSSHIVGLFPKGSFVGMYGGAVAWVPAQVKPYMLECSVSAVIDAWRVSLSEEQYQAVLARSRSKLAKPPLWNMFGYNCNHFAAEFGDLIGLRKPANKNLPAFAYLPAYIEANPERAQR
jgi:hypothetical protein